MRDIKFLKAEDIISQKWRNLNIFIEKGTK
jgi:hypothetical protein